MMAFSQSLSSIAFSERLALRRQWRRSGQCFRCFHACISKQASTDSNQAAPPNAPRRGPTRQQRAAMISEEVKMIQRDHSSPTFKEPDPDTLRPPGSAKTIDLEVLGEGVGPGRMGANNDATREGPEAQGVGRVVNASEDVVADTTKMAHGARSPHESVTEPAKGGLSVLDAASSNSRPHTLTSSADQSLSKQLETQPAMSSRIAEFKREAASGSYGTSSIVGNQFEGMIADQLKSARRRVGQSGATVKVRQPKMDKDGLQMLIAGKHDPKQYLSGTKFGQPFMNDIAKALSMNGTYMGKDTGKFLKKMRDLVPQQHAAGAQKKPQATAGAKA